MDTRFSRRDAARVCLAAICSAVFLRNGAAYAQAAVPEFDVSTVKPSGADSGATSGITTKPGLLDARNVTLQRCIMGAYEVGPHQVAGGPDWAYSDRFDIMAKTDQPINDDHTLDLMLQSLLADRFKLAVHRETRTIPAFVLEVDKKGPKMESAKGGDSSTNTSTTNTGRVKLDAKNTDMDLFAEVLARKMDLPVVNQTGLKGVFDFRLQWTLDSAPPSDRQTADNVSIYAAVQEQLGLRLRAAKAPVEVLAIDRAEQPSPN